MDCTTAEAEPLAGDHLSTRARALRSSQIRDLLRLADRPGIISLAGGLPDPTGFPVDALAEVAARVIRDAPATALQYGPTEGDDRLRRLVAERHARDTGRPTTPDQVLVTTGSQQALDLLARVLADPGDAVLVDDPGYLGALQAFRAAGLRTLGATVDETGLRVDHVEHLVAAHRPRLLYTVPTFQNPTGVTTGHEQRLALARTADRHDLLVIADEPYADLRFAGTAVAPLASHSDRVVSVGTVSKVLAPGLRVGWIVGPTWLVAAAARAKQAVDLHTSSLAQAIVVEMLSRPDEIEERRAEASRSARRRADALHAGIHAELGDRCGVLHRCAEVEGGMFLWVELAGVDTTALLPHAIEHGTAFVPGAAFAVDERGPSAASLRVSFATAAPERLREGSRRLAAAVTAMNRA
ncbi:MAG: aminotransferase-like domain-containing protein [Acidimicrobiales bacterium]